MISGLPSYLAFATALGCGLAGGVFFGFSAFVMDGLADLPEAQGVAAMQSINRRAVTPLFMTALFGTAVACAGLAIWAAVAGEGRQAQLVLAGAALYLFGTIGVTIAANVPLNDDLAGVDPAAAEAAPRWSAYLGDWTAWNQVRGVAAMAAAAAMTFAACAGDNAAS